MIFIINQHSIEWVDVVHFIVNLLTFAHFHLGSKVVVTRKTQNTALILRVYNTSA